MSAPHLAYVIENDHITSVVTELILRKNLRRGEVQTYVNGQLAFDRLEEALRSGDSIPDLILLDLDMPVMDGWEFLDALVALPIAKQVCVFVLTSSIQPDDAEKAKRYKQVKGFFSKPLNSDSVAWMQHFLQLAGASSRARRLGIKQVQ
ncbi:MAG: response regulator [Janthinobacterium lividum]